MLIAEDSTTIDINTDEFEPYVVPESEIITHLIDLLNNAEKSFSLKAMHIFFPDPEILPLYEAILEKKRLNPDFQIKIVMDAHSFESKDNLKKILKRKKAPKSNHENWQRIYELIDNNVEVEITSPGFPLSHVPKAGHDHTKCVVIDKETANEIVGFGGINFEGKLMRECQDMWVFTQDHNLVAEYSKLFDPIPNKHDYEVSISPLTKLIIDAKRPVRLTSLTIESIMRLCSGDDVKQIVMINQFAPDGKIASLLKRKRKQGVKTYVRATDPSRFSGVLYKLPEYIKKYLVSSGLRDSGVDFEYINNQLIHVKLLLIKRSREDGSEYWSMCFGSHNLVISGLFAGTREASLITEDPRLVGPVLGRAVQLYPEIFQEEPMLSLEA